MGKLQSLLGKYMSRKTLSFGIAGAIGGLVGTFISEVFRPNSPDFIGIILAMAFWGLCLGVFIVAAILAAQGLYLKKAPQTVAIIKALASGGAAGALSGGLAQFIFSFTSMISEIVTWISRAFCWGILGVGLGFGVALFVPNFPKKRAMLAGFIGGFIGGFICNVVGGIPGSFILGFFIGFTISLLEEILRDAWLTIVWGPRETRSVSLGQKPILFGSSPEADVHIFDSDKTIPPVRAIIKIENSKVIMEDKVNNQRSELQNGSQVAIGRVNVMVNMKMGSASGGNVLVPSVPAPSPIPAPGGLCLFVKNYSVPLIVGQQLFMCHTSESNDQKTVTGKIVTNKNDPSKLALRNLSTDTWEFVSPTGQKVYLEPNKVIPLDERDIKNGIEVNFKGINGRIARK